MAIKDIPVFLRWAQYLCSLKYNINIIMLLEFDLSEGPRSWPAGKPLDNYEYVVYGCTKATGLVDGECTMTAPSPAVAGAVEAGPPVYNSNAVLPRSDILPSDMLVYFGILFAIFILFRAVALFALVGKARRL